MHLSIQPRNHVYLTGCCDIAYPSDARKTFVAGTLLRCKSISKGSKQSHRYNLNLLPTLLGLIQQNNQHWLQQTYITHVEATVSRVY